MLMPDLPDPVRLKDALRSVRFVLRNGRDALQELSAAESLPEPAARIARSLFGNIDDLARGVDGLASRLANKAFASAASPATAFARLLAHPHGDRLFAHLTYEALKQAVLRLGGRHVFISETAARNAFRHVCRSGGRGLESESAAAMLFIEMVRLRVVRVEAMTTKARFSLADMEALACFSVLLWLLAERSDADNDLALTSACDLTQALAGTVLPALALQDTAALSGLFERYVIHV
ncbi:hypothetical protein [Rhizobium sp. SSA_523]|uniref:hypothetical protein n=1 Tax=Rhizobium sp. SSA_523 TaxID=2952477 RepID=UPI002090B2EC|nr:hypothetical protein [Rhizobium sp. SSA_523]MCO5733461.1 hypothetical protein [Rhizobium sp. SSA_523]WKC21570.1 hypothetical protein QTJ18_06765 [Rhizobium sp. SSA_523]